MVENRIKKLVRDDQKIRKQMERTKKLGHKLAEIKDQKIMDEIYKNQALQRKEEQLKYNKKKIASLREQIANNIKEQKSKVLFRNKHSKVELDEIYIKRKQEAVENNIKEYTSKAMSTLQQFKAQQHRAMKNQRMQSNHRNELKRKYLAKINQEERRTKRNNLKIKKLEEIETSALDQLKNTTMLHNYVKSRFEDTF